MSEGKMEWWPVEKITTDPVGTYVQVIRDSWWIVNDLGEFGMWRVSGGVYPQCNSSRVIAEKLRECPGGEDVRFLPLAFSPIRIKDYLCKSKMPKGDRCHIGLLGLHTFNFERTECIWCGPNRLAWMEGQWVRNGDGTSSWSANLPLTPTRKES